jgi:non-heme chloroperoxidase
VSTSTRELRQHHTGSTATRTFRTADGVRLRYRDHGHGPVTVLIAGGNVSNLTWQPLERDLLASGQRVIALDRRHAGASDHPGHGMRMARQGADLRELLDGLALHDPVLVGSSLGVSTIWAMIDLFGTQGLAGLVLIDQTPRMLNDTHWNLGHYDLTSDTLAEFIAGFGSEELRNRQRFSRLTEGLPAPPDWLIPLLLEARHRGLAKPLLLDHAAQDWTDVLPRIDLPTLVVGGRHSELWPVEHAAFIAAAVPRSELLIMEHSGHTPMWTEPELLNAHIRRFTAQLRSP